MKNPHNESEYTKVENDGAETPVENSVAENSPEQTDTETNISTEPEVKQKKEKKPKFSGAYYYTDTDESKLAEKAFIRTILTIIAFILQVVVLMLPQGGLEYVTNTYPSYAYVYMWLVFVMLGISVWIVIMNMTRYKFKKRIPKEYAPKNGFARRAFFGAELYIAVNAVMVALELSFVCIHYDGFGLGGLFITAAALAAATVARQVTHLTFKNAELIPPPDTEKVDETDTQDNAK